jgi:hypothetical protein
VRIPSWFSHFLVGLGSITDRVQKMPPNNALQPTFDPSRMTPPHHTRRLNRA